MQCLDHGKKGSCNGGYDTRRVAGKAELLHRLAYCAHHGVPIESIRGQVVMHTCDNRRCINHAHLVLGTQKENLEDMCAKGRHAVHLPAQRQITDEQVRAVRASGRGSKWCEKHLGIKRGIAQGILSGKTYRDII